MYDTIFDDFNTVKEYCKNNGNIAFEESAVFELLENLFPQFGSQQAIQIIIDMLNAQRARDCKDKTDASNIKEIYNENKELHDDDDSIIEVPIPKKIFPFIDLTEQFSESKVDNIAESDVHQNLIKEEGNLSEDNISNSSESDNYDPDLNDPDIIRHVNNDWSPAVDDLNKSNERPMVDILKELFDFDESNQSNNETDIPEMLEENNNDPNNNLHEAIFQEPVNTFEISNTNSSPQDVITVHSSSNSNSSGLEIIDPIPGCSKDTDVDAINRINRNTSLPHSRPTSSPIPGCSSNYQTVDINSSDFSDTDEYLDSDEPLQKDAEDVHEIVPWANISKIVQTLKKYFLSENRKQLTLWDLMSENSTPSSKSKSKKRKHTNNDIHVIPRKDIKRDYNSICNESLLDSISNSCVNNITNNEPSIDESFNLQSSRAFDNSENNSNLITENQNDHNIGDTNLIPALDANSSCIHLEDKVTKNNRNSEISFDEETNMVPICLKTETQSSKSTIISTAYSAVALNSFPKSESMFNIFSKREKNETITSNSEKEVSAFVEETVLSNNRFSNNINTKNKFGKTFEKADTTLANTKSFQPIDFERVIPKQSIIKPSKLTLESIIQVKSGKPQSVHLRPSKLNITDVARDQKQMLSFQLRMPPKYDVEKSNDELKLEKKSNGSTILRPPRLGNHSMRQSPIFNKVPNLWMVNDSTAKSNQAAQPSTSNFINQSAVQPSTSNSPQTNDSSVKRPLEGPTRNIYCKLRSMFPEVQKKYIKKLCTTHNFPMENGDTQLALNCLVDHLLRVGNDHLEIKQVQIPVEEQQTTMNLTVDEKYDYLLGIFPKADPNYLRNFVEKTCSTDQDLEQFIQQKLESHDYPTKEEYLAKIKITEQIKQYTSEFNVEKFLELFPDPFKYFEDESRTNIYQPIAMEFLKSFFSKNKIQTISKQYRLNNYNLSLTAKALSELGADMKSKRINIEMPSENIPLLQEIVFVKNKHKILDHIYRLKSQEEALFKDLKEKNLLLTCLCCYNDECMPTKSSECNEGHAFCYECIIKGTETALADGEAHVRCFTECTSEFSLATLQKVLPPTQFSALLKKRQAAEVAAADVEGLVSCPFCYFASIPPPEDKVFKCLNPECMKESCRLCKELNHIPLRCDELIKTDEARKLIEEKMTEALLRRCYQCKKQFYKEEGCNQMKCHCGALMCYVCDKPVDGYNHFNAQGGQNSHLCPLWSDDRLLNAVAVRKVAENIKKTILKKNPNLKIDTEALIPQLPPKSKGPHDDIPNANQLPEHVRRVANIEP